MKKTCNMMVRIALCNLVVILFCFALVACANNDTYYADVQETTTTAEETQPEAETRSSNKTAENEDKKDTVTIVCEVDGCRNNGRYAIEGFSGKTEYYCYTHYNEIQDMIDSILNGQSYGECDNCGRPAEYEWDENTAYCEACFESLLEYIYNN